MPSWSCLAPAGHSWPAGWSGTDDPTIAGAFEAVTSSVSPSGGNYVGRQTFGSSCNGWAYYLDDPVTPDYISWYFRADGDTGHPSGLELALWDVNPGGPSLWMAAIGYHQGALRHALGGWDYLQIMPASMGTWYLIELKNIDWGDNTFDIWVDGVERVVGAPFTEDADHLDMISNYACPSTTGPSYVDDITFGVDDSTPPVITHTVTGTLGNNDWYKSGVSLAWDVSDPESAVTKTGCVNQTITADQMATDYLCSATSDGGTADPVTVTIKRDATAPSVSVTGVTNGATYLLGAVPVAACTTTDAMSGVATPATLSAGYTGGAGSFVVTCSGATDNAGNTGSASVTISVAYDFAGFFQPVDTLVWNTAKAGQAIPVKFSLGGDQRLSLFRAGFPKAIQIACPGAGTPTDPIETYADTAGGSALSYDTLSGQYNYVWKTEKAWVGKCFLFDLGLKDGSSRTFQVQFKK